MNDSYIQPALKAQLLAQLGSDYITASDRKILEDFIARQMQSHYQPVALYLAGVDRRPLPDLLVEAVDEWLRLGESTRAYLALSYFLQKQITAHYEALSQYQESLLDQMSDSISKTYDSIDLTNRTN